MKKTAWVALILPCLILLSSCKSLDLTQIDVGPDNTVAWSDAVTIITDGKVAHVAQAHDLTVRIYMEDGSSYKTKEPQIDEVIRVVERAGKMDEIGIMTQSFSLPPQ